MEIHGYDASKHMPGLICFWFGNYKLDLVLNKVK